MLYTTIWGMYYITILYIYIYIYIYIILRFILGERKLWFVHLSRWSLMKEVATMPLQTQPLCSRAMWIFVLGRSRERSATSSGEGSKMIQGEGVHEGATLCGGLKVWTISFSGGGYHANPLGPGCFSHYSKELRKLYSSLSQHWTRCYLTFELKT